MSYYDRMIKENFPAGADERDALQRDRAKCERLRKRYQWLAVRWDGEDSIDLTETPDEYWGPKMEPELTARIDAAIAQERT